MNPVVREMEAALAKLDASIAEMNRRRYELNSAIETMQALNGHGFFDLASASKPTARDMREQKRIAAPASASATVTVERVESLDIEAPRKGKYRSRAGWRKRAAEKAAAEKKKWGGGPGSTPVIETFASGPPSKRQHIEFGKSNRGAWRNLVHSALVAMGPSRRAAVWEWINDYYDVGQERYGAFGAALSKMTQSGDLVKKKNGVLSSPFAS